MKVSAIALDLRPRSMLEAGDLGVRLVGANARSVARSAGPVFAVVFVIALSTAELASWAPTLMLFCLKPWLDRTLLFVLSRAVFGQTTAFADLWAARSEVWWSQVLPTLTWRRLTPWRSYAAPVQQLEGQRWAERRRRVAQVLRGRRGAAFAMQWAFSWVEFALIVGFGSLVFWSAPPERGGDWVTDVFGDDGLLQTFVHTLCYGMAIGIVEPFFVGAGFAMYLNRRVELEAWDIEQEFRLAFAP